MMATKANHLTGDLSRKKPNLCLVASYDAENYYGNWVLGYGFIAVQFPKKTTRKLTAQDKKEWNVKVVGINGSWDYTIKV